MFKLRFSAPYFSVSNIESRSLNNKYLEVFYCLFKNASAQVERNDKCHGKLDVLVEGDDKCHGKLDVK